MPEYLAPGVYVEEVDTGSKPIEGVSTSTAGMIGVTERGPVNIPILITSYGEFRRWFGDTLDPALYGEHRFLPHAVEGFFNNGGKRVYITRVLDPSTAGAASFILVAEDRSPAATQLLRGASREDEQILVLDNSGLDAGKMVQIGEGGDVEFRHLLNPPASAPSVLVMNLPLSVAHDVGSVVNVLTQTPATPKTSADASDTDVIVLDTAIDPTLTPILQIDEGPHEEFAIALSISQAKEVQLRDPLRFAHPASTSVFPYKLSTTASPTQLTQAAPAGDLSLLLPAPIAAGAVVGISTPTTGGNFDPADAQAEVRRVGELTTVNLDQPAYADYPSSSLVERVLLTQVPLVPPSSPTTVLAAKTLAGAAFVELPVRSSLQKGDILAIGAAPELDLAEIAALPLPSTGDNPGRAVLAHALRFAHPAGASVAGWRGPGTTSLSTVAAVTSPTGNPAIVTTGALGLLGATAAPLAQAEFLRVTLPSGTLYHHKVANAGATGPLTPKWLTLDVPLGSAKAASAAVIKRVPLMEVRALDAGRWGNRLRVGMERQDALLSTQVRTVLPGNALRLDSAAGVEPGTELELSIDGHPWLPVKVQKIDRENDSLITLESSSVLPSWVGAGTAVRTIEYRLVLDLLRQNDPANPSRNNTAIDREVFANLSLDNRHSRYFQSIIGATWDLIAAVTTDDGGRDLRRSDRRSEGESAYIRVKDLAGPSTDVRPGPVPQYEPRPDGTQKLILLPLTGGADGVDASSFADPKEPNYIGQDNANPERRTGLHTLRNVEEISIVAVPGRTSAAMQGALINHCELLRYRFAVLDGQPPPADAMADIQVQRQQFDTKYAALYHPWLLIPHPYPITTGNVPDYPIAPSGHMLGIYARTDIERGVHKAPANEVVRGVTGLQRVINKEQQDILNPYPVNINVIRDFRTDNRGIRVYGGRCITSDSDWKYVNVRRLLIFIEASVDRGLQWVVFEPNAEPLWARVRRSVSNFLTLLWRNGALEGTKPEEAYFVKCDRTTMTQTDIDQGRLICLVGVAPVKPAEFVIVRIGLWTANADN